MIEDPPVVTLKRHVPRPTSVQLAAFKSVPTGFIVDAMNGRGALDARIKAIVEGQDHFCGVALPVHVGPADNLGVMAALQVGQAGDVVVAAADFYQATAVVGDIVLGMMKNKGLLGFVTDGCARDYVGIKEMGLPCFASGLTPNSPVRNGPATVNLPVVCGGVAVDAGDIVCADRDGVVIVPFARIDAVIAALEDVKAAEAKLLPRVKAGLTQPDWLASFMQSSAVRVLD
jgi:4-hydroxy-4-methyl-2-oxoglutarate aldolase